VRRNLRLAGGLLVFAIAFALLQLTRASHQSATWDEPIHLTAGYLALAHGDFRVDPSHPPLARAWAAIPLTASDRRADTDVIDRTPVHQWLPHGYTFAREFVSGADINRDLFMARAMAVIWGIGLGLLVFAWAYEWLGLPAAVLALGLYALEPNLAAHTALVTTDAPITLFVFAAVYSLWRWSRHQTGGNLAAVAVCTALAFITKFSALLLLPILAVLLLALVMRGAIRPRQAALIVGVVAATTLLTVWAAYGFRHAPSDDPNWLVTTESFNGTAGAPRLAGVFGWVDAHHLLPNAFAQGLVFSLSSDRVLPAFLAGDVRQGGWWYYFPVAVALKVPVAILALILAGTVIVLRRPSGTAPVAVFLLSPIVIWLLAAAVSGVNIGVRHVLPVFPFAILLATAAAARLLTRQRAARALLAVALVTVVAEVARSEPYPLSFFNVFAGGPSNGYRYLADSNLGWGGNLKALKRWMDRNHVKTVNLAYFGSVDPAQYGVRATYLPSSASFLADRFARPQLPGYVAISATALDGVYLPAWWRRFYAGFHDLEPVAVVGNTMRVYWVERWPESMQPALDAESLRTLAEGLLFGLRWPERAIRRYDEYLQVNPGDPAAWNGRSLALAQTGRPAEALDGFRRVLALSPSDPDVRQNIALLERQVGRSWGTRE
jgi:hypothetical protein